MTKTCAVFDLDGTIIGLSSEQVFLTYLLEHGEIPILNLLAWIANFLQVRHLPQAKSNKMHLRGLEETRLRDIARTCFVASLRDNISPRIPELMRFHREEGRTIVLMSGSLELLVKPFHEHFRTDMLIAHELEVVDGKFTGRRIGLHPYAQNKGKLALQLAETHAFDLAGSYAYGNHHTDVHKLALFGHPVAVNPDRRLQQIATERGWEVQWFHQ